MSDPSITIEFTERQAIAFGSSADITLVGGGNGGGKTGFGVRVPLADVHDPLYRGFLAMESLEKCKLPGGMLDEVTALYQSFGAQLNKTEMRFDFESGAEIKLSFVGEPSRVDGAQITYGFFDQVEQATQAQAFALVSRLRTKASVRPRIIWSANPPPEGEDHWLTQLVDAGGYLDPDGYPITEMVGIIRYFVRSPENDSFIFGATAEELEPYCQRKRSGEIIRPYSFTFVPMLVEDNKFQSDEYMRSLAALDEQSRLRRLKGKWKGLNMEGSHFKAEYFPTVFVKPHRLARGVRSWDNAWASSKTQDESKDGRATDPDWTNGVREWAEPDSTFLVDDVIRFRGSPAHIERAIFLTAEVDGPDVAIRLPRDPGAAQAIQAGWANKLGARGYTVYLTPDVGDKLTRAQPYIACAQRRQIRLCASHPSQDVALELLQPFEFIEGCGGCQACGKSAAPARCGGDGVVRITIPGLKEADVSTTKEWQKGFVVEHVRFGRKAKGATLKLKGKKDQVDAAVGGYLYLTDPEMVPVEHVDPDMPGLRELAAAAQGLGKTNQRRVTGFGGGAAKTFR